MDFLTKLPKITLHYVTLDVWIQSHFFIKIKYQIFKKLYILGRMQSSVICPLL
jgi:hypothetical protein